jgi:hypothetical protein
VHSVSVSQARCAEIIDDPSLKAYVDGGRFHNKKNPLNYPQPTESQKTKLQEYDQYRKEKRATMAANGEREDTVAMRDVADRSARTCTGRHRPTKKTTKI